MSLVLRLRNHGLPSCWFLLIFQTFKFRHWTQTQLLDLFSLHILSLSKWSLSDISLQSEDSQIYISILDFYFKQCSICPMAHSKYLTHRCFLDLCKLTSHKLNYLFVPRNFSLIVSLSWWVTIPFFLFRLFKPKILEHTWFFSFCYILHWVLQEIFSAYLSKYINKSITSHHAHYFQTGSVSINFYL